MANLADHLKASSEIQKHIEDGDALAKKIASKLVQARTTLEKLRDFAPSEKFKVDMPYHLRGQNAQEASMAEIIKRQIEHINEVLGDRATS